MCAFYELCANNALCNCDGYHPSSPTAAHMSFFHLEINLSHWYRGSTCGLAPSPPPHTRQTYLSSSVCNSTIRTNIPSHFVSLIFKLTNTVQELTTQLVWKERRQKTDSQLYVSAHIILFFLLPLILLQESSLPGTVKADSEEAD
jgi:hypothetical protein